MASRDELLAELDVAFSELEGSVEGLTDEQMLRQWYGDWSVRDILGHVIGWHHEMDDALERISRGERPVPEGVSYDDADAWNRRFAETWQQASPQAVIEELRASKELFVSAIRQVPDDRFEEGRAAFRILRGTGTDHYREHAPEIKAWREREGI
jgi:hypothetical protein